MSHHALGSWTLKSITAVVLITVGAVGAHASGVEAIRYSEHAAESDGCNGRPVDREHGDRGHDDRGRDDRAHDNRDHGGGTIAGPGLQQMISVRVPATTFLRIDKSGRVTAAATNTGCQPNKQDDQFVFRSDGTIEPSTIDVEDCDWRGDFTVPGRFLPQDCGADKLRESRGRHALVARMIAEWSPSPNS
jgi:hypothetical protein